MTQKEDITVSSFITCNVYNSIAFSIFKNNLSPVSCHHQWCHTVVFLNFPLLFPVSIITENTGHPNQNKNNNVFTRKACNRYAIKSLWGWKYAPLAICEKKEKNQGLRNFYARSGSDRVSALIIQNAKIQYSVDYFSD